MQFELGASAAVETGTVVDIFNERIGFVLRIGIGYGGLEGVEIGFHKPRERFEVDEFDGVVGGGICEKCLDTAPFLAMACERSFG